MSLEIEKNKKSQIVAQAQDGEAKKSKGLNIFLWLLVAVIIIAAAVGNIELADQYSTPIRVAGIAVLIVIALAIAAMTNQGKKALNFFSESKTELKRITWPVRQEAMQTTFIVIGVVVVTSLILWGFDSIILSILTFLTDLRF
ncbi:protein translocase subunit secE/sec61 gamma [Cricetibacter osteomyelitidis]|uniref:Protein translocase subunit SecE n=1 Tax=Cricetibacter osteomyelitidis TaxID=1521931 RepID=A0A4R2SQ38_9PAST|nr:preprotein translocase subunit SecE [Cricetibacter osteomyelitidis]TCP91195.1 protein translocase subunit secE/sec61 gamma [Cricetibacter osteomyelitidis]